MNVFSYELNRNRTRLAGRNRHSDDLFIKQRETRSGWRMAGTDKKATINFF
jgi:hypothetical protein